MSPEMVTIIAISHTQVETIAPYAHLAEDSVKESAVRISDSIAGDLLAGYRPSGSQTMKQRSVGST